MREIEAKKLTIEDFHPYGEFFFMSNPSGNAFKGEESLFYPDAATLAVSGGEQIGFSLLTADRQNMIVLSAIFPRKNT